AEEELLEARGLRHERRDADPRLPERDRKRRDCVLVGLEAQRAVDRDDLAYPGLVEQQGPRTVRLRRAEPVTGRSRREQVLQLPLVDDSPLADDRDPVAELFHLVE